MWLFIFYFFVDWKLDLKFDKICSAESVEGAKLGHEMEDIVLGVKKKKSWASL